MDIERTFRHALRYISRMFGRGFQTKVSNLSGAHLPNVNAMIRKDGACSENTRRALITACQKLLSDKGIKLLENISYDDFLNLGQWIIDGKSPEEWAPSPNHGTLSLPGPSFLPGMSGHETDKQIPISSAGGLEGIYHGKLARIFKNKKFASAITHNLDAFDAAIDGDEEMAGLKEELVEIKKILREMQEQQKADKMNAVPDKKRAAQSNE